MVDSKITKNFPEMILFLITKSKFKKKCKKLFRKCVFIFLNVKLENNENNTSKCILIEILSKHIICCLIPYIPPHGL